jgi:hypothetical protein
VGVHVERRGQPGDRLPDVGNAKLGYGLSG